MVVDNGVNAIPLKEEVSIVYIINFNKIKCTKNCIIKLAFMPASSISRHFEDDLRNMETPVLKRWPPIFF